MSRSNDNQPTSGISARLLGSQASIASGWGLGLVPLMLITRDATSGAGDVFALVAGLVIGVQGGALCGGLLGLGQSLLASHHRRPEGGRFVVTLAAFTLAGGLVGLMSLPVMVAFRVATAGIPAWIETGAILGGALGAVSATVQALLLRAYCLRRVLWIGGSLAIWSLAGGAYWAVYGVLVGQPGLPESRGVPWPGFLAWATGTAAAWLVGGLIVAGGAKAMFTRCWSSGRRQRVTESPIAGASTGSYESADSGPGSTGLPLTDPVAGPVLEVLCGLIGFLGVGHLLAGQLGTGLRLLGGWLVALGVVFSFAFLFGHWVPVLLWAGGPLASGLWLHRQLIQAR
jgi:hypothetical protein